MSVDYIIVQAGGKGSRLGSLTRNKPKALVPIDNKPMIFHLFERFPDKKFIIIGDYKYSVLEKYLQAFAEVDYETVCSCGGTGTCCGIREALSLIPENKSFMLIWCDLVLPVDYEMPEDGDKFEYENLEITITETDSHRVTKIMVYQKEKVAEEEN